QVTRVFFFFFSSRRRHTRFSRDWSSDVCSSDLALEEAFVHHRNVGVETGQAQGRTHHVDEGGQPAPSAQALQGPDIHDQGRRHEIGRASCRERGEGWVGGGTWQNRGEQTQRDSC